MPARDIAILQKALPQSRRGTLVCALFLLCSSETAPAATQEYWVCLNAQGVRGAQDHPCAPDQQTVSVPASAQQTPSRDAAPAVAPSPPEQRVATAKRQPNNIAFKPITDLVWKWVGLMVVIVIAITAIKIVAMKRMARVADPSRRSRGEAPDRRRSEPVAWDPSVMPPARPVIRESRSADDRPVTPAWNMEFIRALEWKRFEELCEGYWVAKGYPARLTGPGADGGVDVVIADRADTAKMFAVIQCKAWSSKQVGVESVRALWGAKDHFKAQLALFYSMSGFTDDAVRFASEKYLKLVSGEDLLQQVLALPSAAQQTLLAHVGRDDFRTPTCPTCDIKMVRREGKEGKPDFYGCRNFRTCGSHTFPVRI